MMIKNFLKQERGITLPVGIVVMVILFSIASALFISTQNQATKALSDKAGVTAIAAANVGAERAIWYIQQKLDNDPNWHPNGNEEVLLDTNYDYFKTLTPKNRRPDEYAQECIQVGSTVPGKTSGSIGGVGCQVYAVKLKRGPEEIALGDNIWGIYSLGIDRTPGIFAGIGPSKMELRVEKVIVQLGTEQQGLPDTPINTPGDIETTQGQRIHIGGPPIPGLPVVNVRSWNDSAPLDDPIFRGGIFTAHNPQPPASPEGWGDGWYRQNDFRMAQSQTAPPDIPLEKVGLPGSGADIIADYYIDLNNPNYQNDPRDLRYRDNGWELINNRDGSRSLIPPHGTYTGDFKKIYLFGRHVDPQLLSPERKALYDVNGDGYTVIYIPEGNTNIRIYDLTIMPEVEGDVCRAIIVSRGRGSNLYDGADTRGYVHLPATGWGGRQGERLIAADQQRNSNTAIDIRGIIKPYNFTSASTFLDFIWDNVNQEMRIGEISYGEVRDDGIYRLDRSSGSLSLLADNDIILSTPDANDGGDPNDPQSIIRGLIYSKRNIIFEEDFLLRGAIIAGGNINFVDQSGLWISQRGYGDGFDIAICHENAFASSDGERNLLPDELRPGGGGTLGSVRVISWENIRGRDQIRNTF